MPRLCLVFVSPLKAYPWSVVFSALESFEAEQQEAGEPPSFFFIDVRLCVPPHLLHLRRSPTLHAMQQFCLDQHVMTSTGVMSKQEKQEQVVRALQKSIEVPGKVLMLLVSERSGWFEC